MKSISEEHGGIAHSELGAQLAGGRWGKLFEAAQTDLAHHHRKFRGAPGRTVARQMREEVLRGQ